MPRKPLPGFGHKGRMGRRGATVRGIIETRKTGDVVLVMWTEQGERRYQSFRNTPEGRKEAVAFGHARAEALGALAAGAPVAVERPALTLREVWDGYTTAHWDDLKLTTQRNYTEHWTAFELYAGRHTLARDVTRETLDGYRKARRAVKTQHGKVRSLAQIKREQRAVLSVFRWAIDRDLVPPSKVLDYFNRKQSVKRKVAERETQVPEYTREEVRKLLAHFEQTGPRDSRRWRVWALTYVLAFAGPRQGAARHLEWRDVDFVGRRLHWRGELDKMGTDRWQPIPQPVIDALWVAYGWRVMAGYTGPFVFFRPGKAPRRFDPRKGSRAQPGGRWIASTRAARVAAALTDQPWTYSAFHAALKAAEDATKVPHRENRAAHSFRRHVVSELWARTGNLALAGRYVGDTDLKTLSKSYAREREDDLREMADSLDDLDLTALVAGEDV